MENKKLYLIVRKDDNKIILGACDTKGEADEFFRHFNATSKYEIISVNVVARYTPIGDTDE